MFELGSNNPMNFKEYFSEPALAEFRACGWNEDRRVDLEPVRAMFSKSGVHMHAAAEWMLTQMHGLKLMSKAYPKSGIIFDVSAITEWMITGEAEFYFGLLNKELCPVALGRSFLHITDSLEAVFLLDDWVWYSYSPSLNDILESFLFEKQTRFPSVMIPDHLRPPVCRSRPGMGVKKH